MSLVTTLSFANSVPIECTSEKPHANATYDLGKLSPGIYIKDGNQVCFEYTHYPEYKGQNCYKNNQSIQWEAVALLTYSDGSSAGRDDTTFRVQKGVITDEKISYHVEWGRHGKWYSLSRVDINRLTGKGVNWFTDMHGGESIVCKAGAQKF